MNQALRKHDISKEELFEMVDDLNKENNTLLNLLMIYQNSKQYLYTNKCLISLKDWCDKYANGIQSASANYLANKNIIDTVYIGNARFVVMTKKTRLYRTNKNKVHKKQSNVERISI